MTTDQTPNIKQQKMASLRNDTAEEEEIFNLRKLFLAVYFNDLALLKDIKKNLPTTYAQLRQFPITSEQDVMFSEHIFDLSKLTFLNQKIWQHNDWSKEIMPFIKTMRKKTAAMLAFWKEEFQLPQNHSVIEYNDFHELFYCSDPKDEYDLFILSIPEYTKLGFREIDIALYNKVLCFQFEEVKTLLKQGAHANIDFDKEGDGTAMIHVESEWVFLIKDLIHNFKHYKESALPIQTDIHILFGTLLGALAFQEMFALLDASGK